MATAHRSGNRAGSPRLLGLAGAALVLAPVAAHAQAIDLRADRDGQGAVQLSWAGGAPGFEVYRSEDPAVVLDRSRRIAETRSAAYTDTPPPGTVFFYRVRSRANCFEATADAWVRSDAPDQNFGETPDFEVGNDGSAARALARFNLSTIPSGARIDAATLYLEQEQSLYGDAQVALRRVDGPWSETGLTWKNQPGTTGTYDLPLHPPGSGSRSWDATALVQEWSLGAAEEFGVALDLEPQASATRVKYAARESGSAPQLCVRWTDARAAAVERLAQESAVPPRVTWDRGSAATVEVEIPTQIGDVVEAALDYLSRYPELYGLGDPRSDLFLERRVDDGARSFVHFGRRIANVPASGPFLTVEVGEGKVWGTSARALPAVQTAAAPGLTARQAIDAALAALPSFLGHAVGEPSLEWFDPDLDLDVDSEGRLTWRVGIVGTRGDTGSRGYWTVHVDAETGAALRAQLEERTGDRPDEDFDVRTASFTWSDDCWNDTEADVSWFDENGPTGWPGPGGDSFLDGQNDSDASHSIYHVYYDRFGRRSWNGSGAQVRSFVDVANPVTGAPTWGNAMYSPACDNLRFGDGWAVSDIVGHEFTHGVVRWTANLRYENQSGALNESFADYFGSRVDGDWELGEDRSGGSAPLRVMSNPPAGGQPDHVSATLSGDGVGLRPTVTPVCDGTMPGYNDCGFVHTNSGIPNKVAFLITAGGTHNGIPVGGLGTTKAERLYYDVLTTRLDSSTNFVQFRDETVRTARRYRDDGTYAFTTHDLCDVINAFASVGLGNPDTDCDGVPNAPGDDGDDDGRIDAEDNCPLDWNPRQRDLDGDGFGDDCDPDLDGDGLVNTRDNCPRVANALQLDTDRDGRGDDCDDDDRDGTLDVADNCPRDYNPAQRDLDGDGLGDVCDNDDDDDGDPDADDNCPRVYNPSQLDADGDGVGTVCDNCPSAFNDLQTDTDADGLGDVCDDDLDGDGLANADDNCPDRYNSDQLDNDLNGIGLACDLDEQADLDGMRLDSVLQLLFDHQDLSTPIRVPLFPCRDDTCPGRLDNVRVDVEVDLFSPYRVRIVDDRGFVYDQTKFAQDGKYALGFGADARYFYRSGPNDVALRGRQYFLELLATPQTQPGTAQGTIRVRSTPGQ